MWLKFSVETLDGVGKESELREIEGAIFEDDDGNEKRFKIVGMLPMTTTYARLQYPEVDWDETNPHVSVVFGKEITENE